MPGIHPLSPSHVRPYKLLHHFQEPPLLGTCMPDEGSFAASSIIDPALIPYIFHIHEDFELSQE